MVNVVCSPSISDLLDNRVWQLSGRSMGQIPRGRRFLPSSERTFQAGGKDGAWVRLERGELSLQQFYQDYTLSQSQGWMLLYNSFSFPQCRVSLYNNLKMSFKTYMLLKMLFPRRDRKPYPIQKQPARIRIQNYCFFYDRYMKYYHFWSKKKQLKTRESKRNMFLK